MPPENKIVKLNLEKRAITLRKDKSIREIARILSSESGHTISKSVVQTYFNRQDAYKSQALETAGCLGTKVIEAEIDTIAKRQEVIEGLLGLAKNAHNEHARVQAYKAANDALDSLDARLGKLSPRGQGPTINLNNINVNNARELPDAELIRIIEHDQED